MNALISRRRFISVSAVALGASLVPDTFSHAATPAVRWRGVAMGAEARLILVHPDRARARAVLVQIEAEIRRLEKVFSLFDPASALSRLNARGRLDAPPFDLVRCLDDAQAIGRQTDGAFDVTVQPLWGLYARHFAARPERPDGPSQKALDAARRLIDYTAIRNTSTRISFARPGMAVTLNGIAQGYMTDRVAELLKEAGFEDVLINLGEVRGLGSNADGAPWRVGIKAIDETGSVAKRLPLTNAAIATSGGYGTRFSLDGRHHHLFDPKTGESAHQWRSLSVITADATRADALSTAFYTMGPLAVRNLAKAIGVGVVAYDGHGWIEVTGSSRPA